MSGRPNVILIMADQHKATSLGMYGNPDVTTPGLERLAANGVRYQHAFTPHPLCVPARTSFWTGSYPHNHGIRTNELRLKKDMPSYLTCFQDVGYQIGLIGKNHCFDTETCHQFDTFYEYGHFGRIGEVTDPRDERFRDWISEPGRFATSLDCFPVPLPADHCPAARIAEQACQFITSADRPFLLWMSFPEPHEPYCVPEPFFSQYDPDQITLPPARDGELDSKPERQRLYSEVVGLARQPEDRLRQAVAAYYASISFVDAQVQRVIDTIKEAGLEDDTIIVYVSDHGDFSGEHGLVVKCNSFYDCLTRVPLLMSWPGHIAEGAVVDDLVSLIDIMPTVAALAGVSAPSMSRGRSLPGTALPAQPRQEVFAEYGAGGPSLREMIDQSTGAVTSRGKMRFLRAREAEGRAKMVRTHEWKYVFDPTAPDAEEFYDLRTDPWELDNIAGLGAHSEVIEELRSRLLRWSVATEDTVPIPLYYDRETLEPTNDPLPYTVGD